MNEEEVCTALRTSLSKLYPQNVWQVRYAVREGPGLAGPALSYASVFIHASHFFAHPCPLGR